MQLGQRALAQQHAGYKAAVVVGLDHKVFLVARVAQATAQFEIGRHGQRGGAKHRQRGVLLAHQLVAVLRAGGQAVVAEALDLVVFLERKHTGLPADGAVGFGLQAQLLGQLLVLGDAVGRLRRKRDVARPEVARAQEAGAVATVDVAAAVGAHGLDAGDGMQRHAGQADSQAQAAAVVLQLGAVLAVVADLAFVKARHQVVGAGLDDVGAEETGRSVEVTCMHVEQRVVGLATVELQLRPHRVVAVAFQLAGGAGGNRVLDPVVTRLAQHRDAHGHVLAQRDVAGRFGVDGAERAKRKAAITFGLFARAHRFELDHAGRCVAAEQRALRAAQHFNAVNVKDREALQDGVFLHHVVINQRHRL